MYNNEETRILNPEANETAQKTVETAKVNNTSEANNAKPEWGKRAASVGSAFVGGVAGAAAAETAGKYINNEEEASVDTVEESSASHSTVASAASQPTSSEDEVVATPEDEVIATPEEGSHEMPSDASLVSNDAPINQAQPAANPTNGDDGEVRVVGVQAVQNEDGSQAIVAGLELDGDQAMVVDVNSDGTINLFIHDDNGDGQISDDEVHDITADNVSTQAIIDDALAQQANENLYYASDDTPDYMNDADTGYIEA